jgi:hypothetical protein
MAIREVYTEIKAVFETVGSVTRVWPRFIRQIVRKDFMSTRLSYPSEPVEREDKAHAK